MRSPTEMFDDLRFEPAGGLFAEVLEAIPDPVLVKDEQHRWVLFNDAFCHLMGRARHELVGKSDFDFCRPEEARGYWTRDELVLESGSIFETEEVFTDLQGMRRVLLTRKASFVGTDGRPWLVATMRDITARRELEVDAARKERDALVGALTASVAHEINTPLACVTGNVSYVLDTLPSLLARVAETSTLSASEMADVHAALQDALRAAERVGRVVSNAHQLIDSAATPHDASSGRDVKCMNRSTTSSGSAPAAPLAATAADEGRDSRSSRSSQRLRVLFIDDEPLLHRFAKRAVGARHDVTGAESAASALGLLERDPDAFDVVVCDLRMPQMSGFELYDLVCERWPRVAERFVFATGGLDTATSQARLVSLGRPWIAKPYTGAVICEAIASVLGDGAESGDA